MLFIILFSAGGYAFQEDIGGSAKDMALGFTSNANSSFLTNPSSMRSSMEFGRSELFASGVFYSFLTSEFLLGHNFRLGVALETISDQDLIDNSHYGQKLLTVGMSCKLNKMAQLGVNIRKETLQLLEEEIGTGLACDFDFAVGPWKIKDRYLTTRIGAQNIAASRVYKNRTEIPELSPYASLNINKNAMSYTLELKNEEFRMGVEYKPLNSLVLRTGIIEGQPTFGFGFGKGNWHVDCAYWIARVGAVYRITTGFLW